MDGATAGPTPATDVAETDPASAFEAFFRETEPKLRRALIAAYGPDLGRDAASEALTYAWEHWERLSQMANLPGYLFRIGQTRGIRRKRQRVLHGRPSWPDYRFEPALPGALAALSDRQRLAVVLVHGYGYTLQEVAELTGLRKGSVQTHAARGLARLRAAMTSSRSASEQ
ncbi:MAG: sigma-70 family RNA polymerase sigma factor [Actinobacteria bacterium]|nr:sigma-70 family RNA polymerase sigma factor [Actinomycetota bacterium]